MLDNATPAPSLAPPAVRFVALGAVDLQRAGGEPTRALLVQPKRLALFAYLALARPHRLHRRDALLALFWPEATDEQARRSLRQALHFIRQAVGPDALASRGDAEVGVAFEAVWCDAHEFERAADAGRLEEALALYRGHLLEGFHVGGVSAELEQWLDDERARLRARAVQATAQLAERAEREGQPGVAAGRLRDLLRLDPASETALRRLMRVLAGAGDRGAALRAYEEFARRLAADIGAGLSRETTALAEQIRAGAAEAGAVPDEPRPAAPAARPSVPTVPLPATAPAHRRPGWHLRAGVVAAGAALVAWVAWPRGAAPPEAADYPRVVAVGTIADRVAGDSSGDAAVLRDLLATDLARIDGLEVVSESRLVELRRRLGAGSDTATLASAARAAGATEVLEGELYRRGPGALRLDVRRVDLARGVTLGAYTAEGGDLFAVVDRLGARLAGELGARAPSPALARLTTTSLVARRLYDEGRRALWRGEPVVALRLFDAALAEDSTFAMAAYHGATASQQAGDGRQLALLAQAMRHAGRATARERLLIAAGWTFATNAASALATADTLARRYPNDLEAQLALGTALEFAGEFARAVPVLERVVRLDTAASRADAGEDAPCLGCSGMALLATVQADRDSAAAAERVLRAWTRFRPSSPAAWWALAAFAVQTERGALADSAWTRWRALVPGTAAELRLARVQLGIRGARFASVDSLLDGLERDGGSDVRRQVLWWRVVSLRHQGRLAEALAAAERLRASAPADPGLLLPQAQVLLEAGRWREAAAGFERHAQAALAANRARFPAGAPDAGAGVFARALVWPIALSAEAWAHVDTARLARLADSVQRLGAAEAYGRDRRMHHYLRGLLLAERGDTAAAIAELRRALVSPVLGFTRINLHLGRLLTASGRPREAVAVLAPALRGELESSNYYVTRTALHAALAEAWERAGGRDSARVHRGWVERASGGSATGGSATAGR